MANKAASHLQRSPQVTSEKILKAARMLFVENGFSGTSMGQIAMKAGVNHSLLFHHFKNKQNLWQEVKQAIFEEGKAVYVHLPSLDQPLESYITELITRTITFYKHNPDIVRMINWQRLESSSERTIPLLRESSAWIEACIYYQKKGEVNPTLKPEFIITLVYQVISSLAMDPAGFVQDPENIKHYIDFVASSLYKAIKA